MRLSSVQLFDEGEKMKMCRFTAGGKQKKTKENQSDLKYARKVRG